MARKEYVPLPIPQSDSLEELKKYINVELVRLAAVTSGLSQTAAAQMNLIGNPVTDSVNTATTKVVTQYDNVSLEDDITPNITTGVMTAPIAGEYLVNFTTVVKTDANNVAVTFTAFVDGVARPQTSVTIFLKTMGDYQEISFGIVGAADRGASIDIRVFHDSGSTRVITYDTLVLNIEGRRFLD